MRPLVKVLRLVEIDEAIDQAKEEILKNFDSNESKYEDVFAIIGKWWGASDSPILTCYRALSESKIFYDNPRVELDEVNNGFFDCI